MENQEWIVDEPQAAEEPATVAPAVAGPAPAAVAQAVLVQKIRSWGRWLLLLGVIHLIASGFLNPSWGLLLIALGLASFYFQEPAMLVLYAITVAWAGVSNLTGGATGWIIFAVVQFFMAYTVLREFLRFRAVTAEYANSIAGLAPKEERAVRRAARLFPWAGLAASVLAAVLMIGVWATVFIVVAISPEAGAPGWLGWLADLDVNLAVLALGLGVASLLARYRYKGASIVAAVLGGLLVAAWLAMMLFL